MLLVVTSFDRLGKFFPVRSQGQGFGGIGDTNASVDPPGPGALIGTETPV